MHLTHNLRHKNYVPPRTVVDKLFRIQDGGPGHTVGRTDICTKQGRREGKREVGRKGNNGDYADLTYSAFSRDSAI